MRVLVIMSALTVLAHVNLAAQSPGEGNLIVHQLHVCPAENQGGLNRFWDEVGGPVLDQLRTEGAIVSWAHYVHAWGDEWNNVLVIETRTMEDFLAFSGEYARRLSQSTPAWQSQLLPLCTAHKDNFYRVRRAG